MLFILIVDKNGIPGKLIGPFDIMEDAEDKLREIAVDNPANVEYDEIDDCGYLEMVDGSIWYTLLSEES